jgi:uncharacterized protein
VDTTLNRPLAVVTGASSGIGFELAKQFAQNGFDLVVAAESEEIDTAAQSFARLGAKVETVRADLATYDGVEQLYDRIKSLDLPVAALALNAGVGVGGEFAKTDLQAELNLIAINIDSTVHLAKRIVNDMLPHGRGKILFTSSIVSQMPSPFQAVYAASKAFVHSFAEAIRNELKDTGITVTALMPGATDTNFFDRAGLDDTKAGEIKKDDPAKVAKMGFDALMAGKDSMLAESLFTKISGAIGSILPDTVSAELNRKINEPGSASK